MILGSSQNLTPSLVGGNRLVPGRINKQSRISEPDSRGPETETGSLEIPNRVQRIHGTLETGLHMMLHSPKTPTRGAGGLSTSAGSGANVFAISGSTFHMYLKIQSSGRPVSRPVSRWMNKISICGLLDLPL